MNRKVLLIGIVLLVLAATAGVTFGLLSTMVIVPNSGVFASANLRVSVTSIEWGTIRKGIEYQRGFTVTNNGTVPLFLRFTTADYAPPETSSLTIGFDRNGTLLQVDASTLVTVTLLAPTSLVASSFSFNIMVTGEE